MSAPEQIREALAREDFADAACLFAGFAAAAPDAGTLAQAKRLVALAIAGRAHLQDRLEKLRSESYVAHAYGGATPRE